MKRLINASIVYAALALVGVVFYREFTKLNDFSTYTLFYVGNDVFFDFSIIRDESSFHE